MEEREGLEFRLVLFFVALYSPLEFGGGGWGWFREDGGEGWGGLGWGRVWGFRFKLVMSLRGAVLDVYVDVGDVDVDANDDDDHHDEDDSWKTMRIIMKMMIVMMS